MTYLSAQKAVTIESNERYIFERLIYPSASPSVLTEEGLAELAKIDTAAFHYARLAAIASDKLEDEKLLEKLVSLVSVLKSQIDAKDRLVIEYKNWITEKGYIQEVYRAADQFWTGLISDSAAAREWGSARFGKFLFLMYNHGAATPRRAVVHSRRSSTSSSTFIPCSVC